MNALRDAMNVMTSMKEVYDTVLGHRIDSQLSDNERTQLANLKKTIMQAVESGDAAWSDMVGGDMTSEQSSAILSFVRIRAQIVEEL